MAQSKKGEPTNPVISMNQFLNKNISKKSVTGLNTRKNEGGINHVRTFKMAQYKISFPYSHKTGVILKIGSGAILEKSFQQISTNVRKIDKK